MIRHKLTASLCWSLFAAGSLGPVAVGVALRVLTASPASPTVGLSPALELHRCDPTRLDDACLAGTHCVAGLCEPLRRPVRRSAGEVCTEALCEPGLECFRGRCFAPEQLPRGPAQCEAPEVWAALAFLQTRCAGPDAPDAPLTACPTETWERISGQDPQFERRLGELPGTFSLHFPVNAPDPAGKWFLPAIEGAYLQQLKRLVPRLQAAKQVLIVGRASVEGDGELNRALAERRAVQAEALLRAALGETTPPLRRWALASHNALALEFFQDSLREPPVAWSPEIAVQMRDLLAVDLARLPHKSWQWLSGAINRVVIVVPLDCDGREFYPAPSFQGGASIAGEESPP